MLFSFIAGFIGLLVVAAILWKKNAHLSQFRNGARILLAAFVSGLTTSFFLSIVICTLTPSLITVEEDLSYTEELSFFSKGEFIGFGGSYIVNNSNRTLKLVGIGEDKDIDVTISSGNIEKIRKCPEVYFKDVPEQQYKRITRTRRGKRKTVSGASVYLIEY